MVAGATRARRPGLADASRADLHHHARRLPDLADPPSPRMTDAQAREKQARGPGRIAACIA